MKRPEKIKIYLRVRPTEDSYSQFEINQNFSRSTIKFTREKFRPNLYVNNQREIYDFKFDGIITDKILQPAVFERCAKDCVISSIRGYNGTIFCYGQTGSGKTWTMTGGTEQYEDRGIIPRVIDLLFSEIGERQKDGTEFTISISFLEIYNGRGYDLLAENREVADVTDLPPVTMFEDGQGNMLLRNIKCKVVRTEDDALNLLWVGDSNRVLAETEMNQNSSRSHCIFTINIESKKPGSSVVKFSKLHLVDLAGSERIYKTESSTGNVTGKIVQEARGINLSLHYLEQVIVALSEKKDFIPYRNCMMTTVLRDSIGGNCKTVMIATVNPSLKQLPETISTCRFAQRVASIKQNVMKNEKVDPQVLIRMLKKKVAMLREKLSFYENQEKGGAKMNLPLTGHENSIIREKIVEFCKSDVKEDTLNLGGDYRRIVMAFSIFKDIVNNKKINVDKLFVKSNTNEKINDVPGKSVEKGKNNEGTFISSVEETKWKEKLRQLQVAVDLRNIEVDILVSMLSKKNKNRREVGVQFSGGEGKDTFFTPSKEDPVGNIRNAVKFNAIKEQKKFGNEKIMDLVNSVGMVDRVKAFQQFRKSYRRNEVIEKTKENLRKKYEVAKDISKEVNKARLVVQNLKSDLLQYRTKRAAQELVDKQVSNFVQGSTQYEIGMKRKIFQERDKYLAKIEDLKRVKKEIEHLQRGLEQSRIRLNKDFQRWFKTTVFKKDDYVFKKSKENSRLSLKSFTPKSNRDRSLKDSLSPKVDEISLKSLSPKSTDISKNFSKEKSTSLISKFYPVRSSFEEKKNIFQPKSSNIFPGKGKSFEITRNKNLLEKLRRFGKFKV